MFKGVFFFLREEIFPGGNSQFVLIYVIDTQCTRTSWCHKFILVIVCEYLQLRKSSEVFELFLEISGWFSELFGNPRITFGYLLEKTFVLLIAFASSISGGLLY